MSGERVLAHPSVSLQSMSGVACGTIVHNDKNQVASDGRQTNSCFTYDPEGGTTTEVSRTDAVLESSGETAHVELGSLVTVGGEKSMKNVIQTGPFGTVVSSLKGTLVSNMTIDGSIAWDRDESCLYLSANRAFRFRYAESDGVRPSMLVLEGLNPNTLEYKPKIEFFSD